MNMKATTYSAAALASKAALDALNEFDEAERGAAGRLSEIKQAMRKAVETEDFSLANQLKAEREGLESARTNSRERRKTLSESFNTAHAQTTSLFFKEHPGYTHTSEETVTRVTVVDPATEKSDDAVYVESSKTISLSVGGKYFESEAYHVGDWAVQNGLMVHWNQVKLHV